MSLEQRYTDKLYQSVELTQQSSFLSLDRALLWQGIKRMVEFLIPLIIVGGVWELLVRLGVIQLASLPAPSTILQKLWVMLQNGVLLQHIAHSFYRLSIGYFLAVTIGITIGALLALNQTLRDMFSPILSLLISVPTIAWVPVLLMTMGLGDKTVITAVFLGGIFAMTYNTMRGMEMVNKSLVHAGKIMGVRGVKLFFSVLLPGSLVFIITGLRLSIGYSWRALVGGEMLSALVEFGVGKMIYQARFWNDIAAMFVGLLVIGVLSLILDQVFLRWLERATAEKWGMLTEG